MRTDLVLYDTGITDNELSTIHTCLRIIYAEHDSIKESHILQISRLIPGATVMKINHCRHTNILNKPNTIEDIWAYLLAEETVDRNETRCSETLWNMPLGRQEDVVSGICF